MTTLNRLFSRIRSFDEPRLLSAGWERYARRWRAERCEVLLGQQVEFLGDEWTVEDPEQAGSSYGLPLEVIKRFGSYLSDELLDRYLPARAEQGLEIGPGGGRLTALLLPRTNVLHVTDTAK